MMPIADMYDELNGPKRIVIQEKDTKDKKGRILEVEQTIDGQIHKITLIWHRKTGVHLIRGLIRRKWIQSGGIDGLGYPLTDESDTEERKGRYNDFERGSIYYLIGEAEAFIIRGNIREKWSDMGGVTFLGYPTTDERIVQEEGKGRFNDFKSPNPEETDKRSIYWHPKTGAHIVRGSIRYEWLNNNGVAGLGYPTTDEEDYTGNQGQPCRISYFQKGEIIYYRESGLTFVSHRGAARRDWFYIRLAIFVTLGIIWGACCIYAILSKNFWLLWILLPSGGTVAYLLEYLFRRIGKHIIDILIKRWK